MTALKVLDEVPELTKDLCNTMLLELFDDSEGDLSLIVRDRLRFFIGRALTTLPCERLEEAFILINSIYTKLYPNKATLDVKMSKDVRVVIRGIYGYESKEYELVKKLVCMSKKEKYDLVSKQKNSVYQRCSDRIDFTIDEVYQAIERGLDHEDAAYRLVAILMMCGARPVELLGPAKFKTESSIGPHWVSQDYIAKRKSMYGAPVIKPLIKLPKLTAARFIHKLEEVRTALHTRWENFLDEEGEVRRDVSKKLNEAAKDLMYNREGAVLYTARKIYGNVTYHQFYRESTIYGKNPSYCIWLNNVLGHDKRSTDTANNYSNVDIIY